LPYALICSANLSPFFVWLLFADQRESGFLFLHKKIPPVRDQWQNSESYCDEITFDHRQSHFIKKTAVLSIITPVFSIKSSYMVYKKINFFS